jgi:hypothetical protein
LELDGAMLKSADMVEVGEFIKNKFVGFQRVEHNGNDALAGVDFVAFA